MHRGPRLRPTPRPQLASISSRLAPHRNPTFSLPVVSPVEVLARTSWPSLAFSNPDSFKVLGPFARTCAWTLCPYGGPSVRHYLVVDMKGMTRHGSEVKVGRLRAPAPHLPRGVWESERWKLERNENLIFAAPLPWVCSFCYLLPAVPALRWHAYAFMGVS